MIQPSLAATDFIGYILFRALKGPATLNRPLPRPNLQKVA